MSSNRLDENKFTLQKKYALYLIDEYAKKLGTPDFICCRSQRTKKINAKVDIFNRFRNRLESMSDAVEVMQNNVFTRLIEQAKLQFEQDDVKVGQLEEDLFKQLIELDSLAGLQKARDYNVLQIPRLA